MSVVILSVKIQLSTYNLLSDWLAEWPALQKQVTSASLCEHLCLVQIPADVSLDLISFLYELQCQLKSQNAPVKSHE